LVGNESRDFGNRIGDGNAISDAKLGELGFDKWPPLPGIILVLGGGASKSDF
jgi:hypothetical protein